MHQSLESRHVTYNALLGIAQAGRDLKKLGGREVVDEVLEALAKSRLRDVLAIRLLHKHNDISAREVMFESPLIDDEGFALVTQAVDIQSVDQYCSNSWQLIDDQYVPIEYSMRGLMADPGFSISAHLDDLRDLTATLKSLGVQHLLGPCLNYGNSVLVHRPVADAAFLEKTNEEYRANVLRYVLRDDVSFLNSTETKWAAVRRIDTTGKPGWTAACTCFCSVFPEGGHIGTKTHQYKSSTDTPEE